MLKAFVIQSIKKLNANLKLIILQNNIEGIKFMYAHECIIITVIMHCRGSTPKSIEFRSKIGFNQYDITLTKEQSVLKSIMGTFEGENM